MAYKSAQAWYHLSHKTNSQVSDEKLGAPVIALALLIFSFFYVLPLGRFTLAGFGSDFRLYDFLFPVFLLFISREHWKRLRIISQDKSHFYFYAFFLIFLVIVSLSIVLITRGWAVMPPILIRTYRFAMYFLIGAFAYVLIDTPHKQRFILGVFYLNILIQTVLAFLQAIGRLPSFWPDYWLANFGFKPVGTLSPHHLQIAVIMFLGIALSVTFVTLQNNWVIKLALAALIAMMVYVLAMAGTRTVWIALVGWVLIYVIFHRQRGLLPILSIAVIISIIFFVFGRDVLLDPVQEIINYRVFEQYERTGIEGLIGERTNIYSNPDELFISSPWVLMIGTGFQNISYFLTATGAHNNYLHALIELGVVGFVVYMRFLWAILSTLRKAEKLSFSFREKLIAQDVYLAFWGILITMLAGETLWAQYSMFTLSGQVFVLVGIAASPLNWVTLGLTNEKLR